MKKKRVIFSVLLICVILVIVLEHHYKKDRVTSDTKFSVPQMEEIPEGETKTYVFPEGVVQSGEFSWQKAKEFVDDLNNDNPNSIWFEKVELRENGQV
ncbi:MAG: hypothetical protein PHX08_13900, partial [Lachnospiraceae bacterium]|nr:hypothetical protein [Lachnospiraceae bacterium]